MNRYQRIVVVIYCLAIAYCCVWIPWQLKINSSGEPEYVWMGYGWIWAGPHFNPSPSGNTSGSPDFDTFVAEEAEKDWYAHNSTSAAPNMSIMALRFAATTAFASAAFLLAGMKKSGLAF